MDFLQKFNIAIMLLFIVCYFYQYIYIAVALLKKPKKFLKNGYNKYAVLIAARNEEAVIQELIQSLKTQKYPAELLDIYVVADNCTDGTADIARASGAIVFERFNTQNVGKGYALDFLFGKILEAAPDVYDGFFIFDADNLADENFVLEMDKVFTAGYRVVTSYRNSKNFGDNWLSASHALWFMRECKFLNDPRMKLGISAAVNGTGFLVHSDIIKSEGGWKYHLLGEDNQFNARCVIKGEKIGYCENAVVYDEQPTLFEQSWAQRLRWNKGGIQIFFKYGKELFANAFKSFSCADYVMNVFPAMFLAVVSALVNICAAVFGLFAPGGVNGWAIDVLFVQLGGLIAWVFMLGLNMYLCFFLHGFITLLSERKRIHCGKTKKLMTLFAFPAFMCTYIPVYVTALFKKIEWKPIKHSVSVSISEIHR